MINFFDYSYWKLILSPTANINRFSKVSVESLLLECIIFSNTLDLKITKMYPTIGYDVIFKYKNEFISCIEETEELF